jgi:hypothetical protein
LGNTISIGKGKREFFIELVKNNLGKPCKYCKELLDLDRMSLDHITPFGKSIMRSDYLVKKKLDSKENIQIICKRCNQLKGNLPEDKFIKFMKFLETDEVLKEYVIKKIGQSTMMWSFKRKYK